MYRIIKEERGQGLVEYALIIALVALAAVVALGFLSTKINTLFSKAGNSLNNVPVASGGVGPTPPVEPGNGTTISAANSNPFTNASGVYYRSGQIEVCSPNTTANLIACGLGSGSWAIVNEGGVYVAGSRSGACSFTYTATNYPFSGTWNSNEGLYRVIAGDNFTDFVEACLP